MNRIKHLTSAGLLAVAFGFAAQHASAGTTYRLDGDPELRNAHHFSYADGVDITATGQVKSGGVYEGAKVHRNGHGLGVSTAYDESLKVDGLGGKDTVWLSFSELISIETVKFRVVDAVDEFVRVFKGDGGSLGLFSLSPLVSDGVAILDLNSLGYAGTRMGLQAAGKASSWRVNWVEGSTQRPEQQITTTFVEEKVETYSAPAPAAAGLGLAGLAGTLFARRRRA